MANTYNEYDANGSQNTFDYDFPYLKTTDVKVSVDGVLKQLTTDYTRPTVTRIQFNSDKIPANGAKVRVYRDTDEATVNATFYPGSAIKSSDLNDNFLQAVYIGEEGKENADDAWNKLEDSIDSTETWVSDNTKIGTTGAVDARINTELTNSSKNFSTSGTLAAGATTVTGNIAVSGTVDGRDVAADGTKLDGIEASATADQTNAEIRAAVEAASDSNVFTDADHSKLNAIEASATADQTASEIRTLVGSASDSNVFTDADHTKLDGIEASATADQTATEIKTAYESNSDTNAFTDADHTKLDGIETSATADQTAAEIKTLLASDQLTTTHIADGQITQAKLANNDVINTDQLQDGAVTEVKLGISNAGTNGQFLQKQSGNTGGLTWASVTGGSGGGSVGGDTGIDFNDSVKIRFGTGEDLQIYHDGTDSFIYGTTGTRQLKIRGQEIRVVNEANSEIQAKFIENGAVELYYDGVKKLETQTHGVTVTDSDTSVQINMVNSSGTAGYLYGEGTTNFGLLDGQGHYTIKGIKDGAVELYHNNVKKLTTYSKGAEIHGSEDENCELYLYADQGTDDADNWKLSALAASSTFQLQNRASSSWETNISAVGNGAVELYHNNDLRLQTWSDGVNIHGDEGEDAILHLYADNGDNNADKWKLVGSANGSFYIRNYTSGAWETSIKAVGNGKTQLYYDDSEKFETTSEGALVIGALGINGQNTTHVANTLKIGHEGSGVHQLRAYGPDTSNNGKIQFNSSRSDGTNPKSITYSAGNLEFPDNQQIRMGAGEDLTIYHNGTTNYVDIVSGQQLYFRVNSANKLYVKSDGAQFVGNLYGDDNDKIKLGSSQDLQVYHDGSNSYIEEDGTGQLIIRSWAPRIKAKYSPSSDAAYTGEDAIICLPDGAVELYYDGSTDPKFETTSTGAKVTGNVQLLEAGRTNLKIGSSDASGAVLFLDGDSNGDVSGNDYAFIEHTTDGDLCFYGDNPNSDSKLKFYTSDADTLALTLTGANATFAGDVSIVQGTNGVSASLYLIADRGDDNGDGWRINSNQDDNDLTISNNTSGSYVDKLTLKNNGDTTFTGSVDIAGAIDENVFTITDASSVALDPDNGTIQIWNLTANRTATDSFTAGQSMLLMISDGSSNTITWPTMTWVGGSAPTLATSGASCIELWKVGSTFYGSHIGDVA